MWIAAIAGTSLARLLDDVISFQLFDLNETCVNSVYDIHIKRDQETYLCARYGEQIAPKPREREFALAALNSPIARYMRVFGRRAKYLENSDDWTCSEAL